MQPEDQGVGAEPDDVREVVAQDTLRARRIRFARLDDLDELRARLLVHADHRVDLLDRVQVLLAAHRALGRDHADAVVLGRLDRRLRAGADDSDDRQLEELTSLVERRGGGRVARDDDELHVARLEVANDVDGEAAHLVLVARSVREMEQVGDVDRRLEREAARESP